MNWTTLFKIYWIKQLTKLPTTHTKSLKWLLYWWNKESTHLLTWLWEKVDLSMHYFQWTSHWIYTRKDHFPQNTKFRWLYRNVVLKVLSLDRQHYHHQRTWRIQILKTLSNCTESKTYIVEFSKALDPGDPEPWYNWKPLTWNIILLVWVIVVSLRNSINTDNTKCKIR